MNINIWNKFWDASPLWVCILLATGCNTTENGFYIGDLSDIKLTTDPVVSQVRLAADGAAQDIKVVSNVSWEIIPPAHPFTAHASSTEGDGIITVSSINNVNSSATPTAELTVRAVDFSDKFFTLTLIQQQLVFQLEEKAYPEAPEQGGTADINIKSSIDWKLESTEGQSEWIVFTPGSSGNGSWDDITVKATWTPNYTTEKRILKLRLYPQNEDWLGQNVALQNPIVLTQAEGTLPADLSLTPLEADKTSVPLTIHYSSFAPIVKVEIKVANMASLEDPKTVTVPIPTGSENYPESGDLSFLLDNLEPGTPYNLTPVITSRVGTAEGNPIRIQTRGDIIFNYPTLDVSEINPEETGVNAFFKTTSEFELTSFKVSLYQKDNSLLATQHGKITPVLDQTNTPISWIGELTWDNNVKLSQNTDYYFELTVTGNDPNRPDTQNTIQHNLGYQHFTTLFRLPEQDDNHPIK